MPYMAGRFLLFSVGFVLIVWTNGAFAADRETSVPGTSLELQHRAEQIAFVNQKLAYWQQRLNLDQWHITVSVARATELRRDTMGNIHWDAQKQTAAIRVLDAADYTLPFPDTLRDVETTIVHELVHLSLSTIPRTEEARTPEEQAVVRLTSALLKQ